MLKVGFSATYGFRSIEEVIEFAKVNGFSAVEINLNMPEYYPSEYTGEERLKLRRMAESKNIVLSFHGPEDINLCSKQNQIVNTGIKILKECIDFACDLGGTRFTFHIGDSVNFTMYNGSLQFEDYYRDDYIEILKSSMGEILSYARDRIAICVENTGYFSVSKIEAIKFLLDKGLYLTWDLGHAYLKEKQMDFMIDNKKYIRNIHIHDVIDNKDHCIIGTGKVDIPYYLSLIDIEKVLLIIEVRPGEAAVKSFSNLKKILAVQ